VASAAGVPLIFGGIAAGAQVANAEHWVRSRFSGAELDSWAHGGLIEAVAEMSIAGGLSEPPRPLLLDVPSVNACAIGASRRRPGHRRACPEDHRGRRSRPGGRECLNQGRSRRLRDHPQPPVLRPWPPRPCPPRGGRGHPLDAFEAWPQTLIGRCRRAVAPCWARRTPSRSSEASGTEARYQTPIS
jgi:hypothetical protein